MSRWIRRTADGLLWIAQDLAHAGPRILGDVTGRHWILVVVRCEGGTIRFRSGDAVVEPPWNPFAVLVPPFQVIEAATEDLRSWHEGVACAAPLPGIGAAPLVFPAPEGWKPMAGTLTDAWDVRAAHVEDFASHEATCLYVGTL